MNKMQDGEGTKPEGEGLSIVIPAFNEAEGIRETLQEVQEALGKIGQPSEVIVVDDGSEDETWAMAQVSGVRVIRHPVNSGYGRSLITGIENATYDTVAIVDADGTYPIEALPELYSFFRNGFDMVVGARQGKHYRESMKKDILRGIFRFLAEFTCGRSIPDINSGFRIFSRHKALAFRPSYSTGFSFTTTITLLFMLNNYFVGYLPVAYKIRYGKSKVRLLHDTLRSLQIIVTAIAQYNPLKLFLLQIILFSLVNALLGVIGWWTGSVGIYWTDRGIAIWSLLNVLIGMALISLVLIKPRQIQVPGRAPC